MGADVVHLSTEVRGLRGHEAPTRPGPYLRAQPARGSLPVRDGASYHRSSSGFGGLGRHRVVLRPGFLTRSAPLALARAVARAAHSPGRAAGDTSDFRGPYPPPPGRVPSTEIGRLCRPPGESGQSRARALPSRRHGRSRRSLRSPESHAASTLTRTGVTISRRHLPALAGSRGALPPEIDRFSAQRRATQPGHMRPIHLRSPTRARSSIPADTTRLRRVPSAQNRPSAAGSRCPSATSAGVRVSRASVGRAPHRALFWQYGPPARSRRVGLISFLLSVYGTGRGEPPCRP